MKNQFNLPMDQLINAAADGRDDVVKEWVEENGKEAINQKDFYDWTALMAAAREGRKKTVNILLDLGADPTITNDHGNTAAYYAYKMNYKDVGKILDDAFEMKIASDKKSKKEAAKKNFQQKIDTLKKKSSGNKFKL